MIKLEDVINKGLALGIEEIELYAATTECTSINFHDSKMTDYNIDENYGISIRGKYQGKMAYVYTESLDETTIDELLKRLMTNANLINSDEEENLTSAGEKYFDVVETKSDFKEVLTEDKIKFLKEISESAKSVNPNVIKNVSLYYDENTIKTQIINSKGLNLTRNNTYISTYISVLAGVSNESKVGAYRDICLNFKDIDRNELMKKSTSDALSGIGAGSLITGTYKTILNDKVATSILSAFSPVFTGESAMLKLTSLGNKIGQKIMGENITIIDNPFNELAILKFPFDDEGVPCKCKNVVEKGVFKGFLHSIKTANAFKTTSTGNGFKDSIMSSVSTRPTNLYLVPGKRSEEELIASLDNGVLITNVSGLHAGVNQVSGDFNLLASGFVIKNGTKERPVTLLVISGNFYEMMNNVEEIGSNITKIYSVASPSIKIKQLMISCK